MLTAEPHRDLLALHADDALLARRAAARFRAVRALVHRGIVGTRHAGSRGDQHHHQQQKMQERSFHRKSQAAGRSRLVLTG